MSAARARLASLSAAALALTLAACSSGQVRSMPSVIGHDASVPTTKASTTVVPATTGAPTSSTGVSPSTVQLSGPAAPATGETDAVVPIAVIDGGPKGLSTGSKGPAVVALENRLTQLRFDPGKADGSYDTPLLQAVMAFQKQQGLKRTGKADPETLKALATASLGAAAVPAGEPTRVEIDLERQIAQFWRDGRLERVLPVSSGNGSHYCVPKDKGGGCDVAVTPAGSFRADRKIQGDRESKLGHLYDPVYFNGGIAIHGSGQVPPTPASHGCIRVPMWESRWVYENVAIGEPVYVVGGDIAPVPFGETAPTDDVEVTAPTDAPG